MKAVTKKVLPDHLPRRVLFLNDVGFQYGAGIAQARQIHALLNLGMEVGALAWSPGGIDLEHVATDVVDPDCWLGIREVNHIEGGRLTDEEVIAGLLLEIARFKPEAILVGNIHAARWPLQLLPALRRHGYRVIAFVHDAFLFTGRCAYPGDCTLYLTGCDETCPTAEEYPRLAPDRIAGAWKLRREIFTGPQAVEIVANSLWSKKMFERAIPGARVEAIHLSADEYVYKPGDKSAARRLLGLPDDKPVVLLAAVNFQERRKGCQYLPEIIGALKDEVTFAAFGHNASEIPGLIGLGYHIQADKLATIYQTADIFLGTATEEAFGQTIMEAQLCGVPVVAFHAGGVDEIVRNEITGKLVRNGSAVEAVAAIRALLADARFRPVAAPWARQYAVSRFSMWAQEIRWHHFFLGLAKVGTGLNAPTLAYPLNEPEDSLATTRHRPSWPTEGTFISEEHAQIFEKTAQLPGWQTPGDSFKLYEMAWHAGDVILEIGTFGGRSATVELRGALANPARTRPPQFYGIDLFDDSISRTRQTLAGEMLAGHCHLFHGVLQDFVQRWSITPTMVFLDGDHSYEGVVADLKTLSAYLRPGTPVLLHDFLNSENEAGKIGVKRAAQEWEAAGHGRFMGCFGCCALYLTLPPRQ
jgi:glycosyltransferase involved in cell wall biosynthesis